MEYLEIAGAVKLKSDASRTIVLNALKRLRAIEFKDEGYMNIRLKNRILTINAEGTISDRFSINQSMKELQSQLTFTSRISVTSVRWELYVQLRHWKPLPAEQRKFGLAFAQ